MVVAIATNRLLFWALMGAQLGLVFLLSARVDKLAASTAALLFVLYSALTGVTIAFVLLAYTGESVASTFHRHRGHVRRPGRLWHGHQTQPRRIGDHSSSWV